MSHRGRVSAVIASVVVAGAAACSASPEETTVHAPPHRTVDPAVSEARLLDSVLYVDGWREYGNPVGFTYVPETRPPGLLEIGPGNPPNLSGGSHNGSGNGARLDSYRLDGLFLVVEFSSQPTETCANATDPPRALCIRDNKRTVPAPDDAAFRHTTVYVTAGNASTLDAKKATAAKRFWSTVDMVPARDAAWFTDLVAHAKNNIQE